MSALSDKIASVTAAFKDALARARGEIPTPADMTALDAMETEAKGFQPVEPAPAPAPAPEPAPPVEPVPPPPPPPTP